MLRNEQVRKDLDAADRVVRACWENFVATEPTYLLRDLIVVEIVKARETEREACAKIASDRAAVCQAAYDAGDKTEVHPLNEALHIAQLIRNRKP